MILLFCVLLVDAKCVYPKDTSSIFMAQLSQRARELLSDQDGTAIAFDLHVESSVSPNVRQSLECRRCIQLEGLTVAFDSLLRVD